MSKNDRAAIILSESDEGSWAEFVTKSNSHFFDTTLWTSTLVSLFSNIRSYRLVVVDHAEIVGGMTLFETSSFVSGRKLVNSPFHLSSSLLGNAAEIFEIMVAKVATLARENRVDYVQLTFPPFSCTDIAISADFKNSMYYYTPIINLGSTYEETFRNYKKQFRTNLNKIYLDIHGRRDVTCVLLDSVKELKEFHTILTMQFKNKHYNLPPPFKLIQKLWAASGEIQKVLVFGLREGKRLIAGSVILIYKEVAHYAWSASDISFHPLAVQTYLMDRVIRSFYDGDNKVKVFHLGPVSPSNKGLCFFKSRWGSQFVRPNIYTFNLKSNLIRRLDSETSPGMVRKMMRFMPVASVRTMSNLFYKHLV